MATVTVVDKSLSKLQKLRARPGGVPMKPGKPGEITVAAFPEERAEAATLRDLIAVLQARSGIVLVPHEPPRFFTYGTIEEAEPRASSSMFSSYGWTRSCA